MWGDRDGPTLKVSNDGYLSAFSPLPSYKVLAERDDGPTSHNPGSLGIQNSYFQVFYFYLCTLVFCLQVYLCDGFRSSGMGITGSCELPCGCLELNPGYLGDTAPRKHLNPKQQICTPIYSE